MKPTKIFTKTGIKFCTTRIEQIITQKEISITVCYILEYDYESSITKEIVEQKIKHLFYWRGADFFDSYEFPEDLKIKAVEISNRLFSSFF